jgi:cytochrome o ubiquinol oxidase subunit 1
MGAGANVNAFFGIMTMLIAIPTGVKVFNWLFTMYRGRILLATPMLWFLAFILDFTVGGMGGVLMSVPAVDFQIHNSLFLIAHFHTMILPGVLFGFFAGFTYWFPKFSGYKLNEKLGKYACYCWTAGFLVAFVPLYVLGFMGATRRLDHYEAATGWQPLFITAGVGAAIISLGIFFQVLQLYVSFRDRRQNPDLTGDPWNGRTLEWATSSPPPEYNFAVLPEVHERDAFWAMKQAGSFKKHPTYEGIEVPNNTSLGMWIGIFSCVFGFAIVWHMFWLVAIGILGVLASLIIRLSQTHTEHIIPPAEIEEIEKRRTT